MLENSSKAVNVPQGPRRIHWGWVVLLPVWTYIAFWLAQIFVVAVQWLLMWLGVPLAGLNETVLVTTLSALVYVFAVVIVVGLPYLVWKRHTSRQELGVPDLPAWMDIVLTVPAYVVYIIGSGVLLALIMSLLPSGIDLNQAQQLPFTQTMLGDGWHYVLAFMTLVVFAPVAEEVLFRGYLYGKLRKSAPVWLSVVMASLAFGAAHLWAGPGSALQWAVAIDTFALSLVLCLLREHTGAIWAGVFVHALKNGLAFYLLFVNPELIEQIQSATLPLL